MRSLRLDPELDEKIQRAAAVSGQSLSEFIRHAAEDRANETLAARPAGSFADIAGVVHGGGGRARRSGEAYAAGLTRDRAAR
jgi:predicted transcriptional regulator